ncbi:hypothetical protein PR048_022466 [Dryococelus australis]|uniref:Uncharacterized protein n=1 Tax=Dryococelus australis TaxID=614101 RepID=A0ABQ9H1D4_9NEOP|nr:hypothetical protein PR048_022466 [Dryococelus australis]
MNEGMLLPAAFTAVACDTSPLFSGCDSADLAESSPSNYPIKLVTINDNNCDTYQTNIQLPLQRKLFARFCVDGSTTRHFQSPFRVQGHLRISALPRHRSVGAVKATLTRKPSASSPLRLGRAMFPSGGGNGITRENPPTNGIVLCDPHLRKSGDPLWIEPCLPWWEASVLTAQPPWPLHPSRSYRHRPTRFPRARKSTSAGKPNPVRRDARGARVFKFCRSNISPTYPVSLPRWTARIQWLALASQQGEPGGSIPGGVALRISARGGNRARTTPLVGGFPRRYPRFPRPCIPLLTSLHPSSALETSMIYKPLRPILSRRSRLVRRRSGLREVLGSNPRWREEVWVALNNGLSITGESEATWIWSRTGAQGWRKTGDPRENPLTSGVVRHNLHLRKPRVIPPGIETLLALVGGECSSHFSTAAPKDLNEREFFVEGKLEGWHKRAGETPFVVLFPKDVNSRCVGLLEIKLVCDFFQLRNTRDVIVWSDSEARGCKPSGLDRICVLLAGERRLRWLQLLAKILGVVIKTCRELEVWNKSEHDQLRDAWCTTWQRSPYPSRLWFVTLTKVTESIPTVFINVCWYVCVHNTILRLNGARYHDFIANELPCYCWRMCQTFKGMMEHRPVSPRHVREHLTETFNGRWIGQGDPLSWPSRSPELHPLDFWLWGELKALVFGTPINDFHIFAFSLLKALVILCLVVSSHGRDFEIRPSGIEPGSGGLHFQGDVADEQVSFFPARVLLAPLHENCKSVVKYRGLRLKEPFLKVISSCSALYTLISFNDITLPGVEDIAKASCSESCKEINKGSVLECIRVKNGSTLRNPPQNNNCNNDAAGRWIFSWISRFHYPCIPALLHSHLALPSSALKTSMLRAAQISTLTHIFASIALPVRGQQFITTDVASRPKERAADCFPLTPSLTREEDKTPPPGLQLPKFEDGMDTTPVGTPRPRPRSEGAIRATLSRAPSDLIAPTRNECSASAVTLQLEHHICNSGALLHAMKTQGFNCALRDVPGRVAADFGSVENVMPFSKDHSINGNVPRRMIQLSDSGVCDIVSERAVWSTETMANGAGKYRNNGEWRVEVHTRNCDLPCVEQPASLKPGFTQETLRGTNLVSDWLQRVCEDSLVDLDVSCPATPFCWLVHLEFEFSSKFLVNTSGKMDLQPRRFVDESRWIFKSAFCELQSSVVAKVSIRDSNPATSLFRGTFS